MDKQLLKAYIRTIVEEEVKRVLPDILGEAVREIKQLSEHKITSKTGPAPKKSQLDRGRLAELMGIEYDGETLRATNVSPHATQDIPPGTPAEVKDALTRDYSQLMKKMGLT